MAEANTTSNPLITASKSQTLKGSVEQTSPAVPSTDKQVGTRERTVEVGRFHNIKPIHVIIYHERFPIWLLLLDSFLCTSITIIGSKTLDNFVTWCVGSSPCSKEFISWLLDRIGHKLFRFTLRCPVVHGATLILMSGSLTFITNTFQQIRSPAIGLVDTIFLGRLRKGIPSGDDGIRTAMTHVSWQRIQHRSLGGPTDFVSLIGYTGLDIRLPITKLRRTVRDIFGAGTRPTTLALEKAKLALSGELQPEQRDFYVVDDVIRVQHLTLPVYHATHFFSSGWGQRPMSAQELGAAFGYPRDIHNHLENWVFATPPFQVLQGTFMSAALVVHHDVVPTTVATTSTIMHTNIISSSNNISVCTNATSQCEETWLDTLSRWLPHTWVSLELDTKKEAKRDDAAVPIHYWDRRIILVVPVLPYVITWLRKQCLARAWRNIQRDFIKYLRRCYGSQWLTVLQYHRKVQGYTTAVAEAKRTGGELPDKILIKTNSAGSW